MQLSADRFLVDEDGAAVDLAFGRPVHLTWSALGGPSEQSLWESRSAHFASLSHPAFASLVDYGVVGESRRFEAWEVDGPWRGSASVSQQVRAAADAYLRAAGFTPLAAHAQVMDAGGRAVVIPDAVAGLDTAAPGAPPPVDSCRVLGTRYDVPAALTRAADLFAVAASPRVAVARVLVHERRVAVFALRHLAGVARRAGMVPVAVARFDAASRALLRGRTVFLLADDDVQAGLDALIVASLLTPTSAHLLVYVGHPPVRGAHVLTWSAPDAETLRRMVVPAVRTGRVDRRVLEAARRARGCVARFEQLLGGGSSPAVEAPNAGGVATRVAEPAGPFGARVPVGAAAPTPRPAVSAQWPVTADLVRLRRQLHSATEALSRGRQVTGARRARQALAALSRRGDWAHAADGAVRLARHLLSRGLLAPAEALLSDARDWAATAGAAGHLESVALVSGRLMTDAGRLHEAQTLLEAALAAATARESGTRVSCVAALARCHFWQGRYQDAAQLLALEGAGAGSEEASVLGVVRAVVALGRGNLADAVASAARARDALVDAGSDAGRAQAGYAGALVQLAGGDLARADEAAAEAHAQARRAGHTMLGICARVLRAEVARRRGRRGPAAALVRRLSRVDGTRLPLLVRARVELLRVLLAADDPADAAARLARSTGLPALVLFAPPAERAARWESADEVAALLQCAQISEEEPAVLAAVCARLRGRLQATTVACFGEEQGQFVSLASDGSRIDASTAARVATAGQFVPPHPGGERVESGVPVRYAGRSVGVLVARWSSAARWQPEQVALLLSTGAAVAAPAMAALAARRTAAIVPAASGLVGVSPAMERVRAAIERASRTPFTVLVEGESGSGKELVARSLHRSSPRRDRYFSSVNCAALPDDLVESELFGHARGAFTGAATERTGVFEEAHGGTLFLDEIGELSPRAQAKVLRAIQEGEIRRVGENAYRRVDVRLVAATNRNLRAEVEAGRFRLDLLYRLDVVRITLPPLRERREDIPLLAAFFWQDITARAGSRALLAPATLEALSRYDWPGNIRELQNVLASLAVRAPRRGLVPPSALPSPFDDTPTAPASLRLDAARHRFEQRFVRDALARSGGRRTRAARELGVTRQGLAKLIMRLGLDIDVHAGTRGAGEARG